MGDRWDSRSGFSLQHELDVQQQLWHKSREQYQLSAENVDLINRKCHDLKHQIAALRRISDRRGAGEESIQALEQSVMIYDSVVKTGNDILDTVLTEKSLLCESRGITPHLRGRRGLPGLYGRGWTFTPSSATPWTTPSRA